MQPRVSDSDFRCGVIVILAVALLIAEMLQGIDYCY